MVTDARHPHGTFVNYFERVPEAPRHIGVIAQLYARAHAIEVHANLLG